MKKDRDKNFYEMKETLYIEKKSQGLRFMILRKNKGRRTLEKQHDHRHAKERVKWEMERCLFDKPKKYALEYVEQINKLKSISCAKMKDSDRSKGTTAILRSF